METPTVTAIVTATVTVTVTIAAMAAVTRNGHGAGNANRAATTVTGKKSSGNRNGNGSVAALVLFASSTHQREGANISPLPRLFLCRGLTLIVIFHYRLCGNLESALRQSDVARFFLCLIISSCRYFASFSSVTPLSPPPVPAS